VKLYQFAARKEEGDYYWVAIVGYKDDVAFTVVAESLDELVKEIEAKAQSQFPRLLETDHVWIDVRRVLLSEISVPDHMLTKALEDLPPRTILGREVPAHVAARIEFELSPILGIGRVSEEILESGVARYRTLIARDEVCAAAMCNPAEVSLVVENGELKWKIERSSGEVKTFSARIEA